MPDTGYLLTEEDRDALRRLLRAAAGGVRNRTGRPDPYTDLADAPPAPEVYVARTPAGGIPAKSVVSAGPGTGTSDDVVGYGSADCDVYKLAPAEDGVTTVLTPVDGLTRRVHNLTGADLAGDAEVVVVRDKFGSWLATGGGGGSDWETYKVVSGEDCDYTLKRVVPDPAGGCEWIETDEPEVEASRMVSVNTPPKVDPDQMTLARPKPGVPGEYEMFPWGSVQKNWSCDETTGLPDIPFWCIPKTMHVLIGTCKFPVVVDDYLKVGYKLSARDFKSELKIQSVVECDDPFDADAACPGVPPPPPPPPPPPLP